MIEKRNDLNQIEKIIDFKNSDDWRIKYLTDFKSKKDIVSLKFTDDLIIYGFITELTNSEIMINGIGHIGEDEGKTIYKIEDIIAFRFADKRSKLRQELYNLRNKK